MVEESTKPEPSNSRSPLRLLKRYIDKRVHSQARLIISIAAAIWVATSAIVGWAGHTLISSWEKQVETALEKASLSARNEAQIILRGDEILEERANALAAVTQALAESAVHKFREERLIHVLASVENDVIDIKHRFARARANLSELEEKARTIVESLEQSSNSSAVLRRAIVEVTTDPGFAAKVAAKTQLLPVGTIISSMLEESEFQRRNGTGWILADGRSVLESEYGNVIGSHVPDLRGVFLRGLNNGRDAETGDTDVLRPIGSYQDDTIIYHQHQFNRTTNSDPAAGNTSAAMVAWGNTGTDRGDTNYLTVGGEAAGAPETRPRNVAVNFFIKIR